MCKKNDTEFCRTDGFSLVELMVAVTVSVVIMSGVAVSVSGYFANEKVDRARGELVSSLNLARNMAVTSQVTSGSFGLDYVAVTLTTDGVVSAFPVNNVSGSGPAYFSKDISDDAVTVSRISFGDLQYGAGSGKLVGKNPQPSFGSYPLPASQSVGVTLSSLEKDITKYIMVGSLGTIRTY